MVKLPPVALTGGEVGFKCVMDPDMKNYLPYVRWNLEKVTIAGAMQQNQSPHLGWSLAGTDTAKVWQTIGLVSLETRRWWPQAQQARAHRYPAVQPNHCYVAELPAVWRYPIEPTYKAWDVAEPG